MAHITFIGRQAELARLEEFLKKAATGQLQVAFIAGEAGAGKSTLVEKFIENEEGRDPTLIATVGECNAHTGSGDPYLPFRQVLTSLTTQPESQKTTDEAAKIKRTARLKEFVRVSSHTLIKVGPDLIGIFVPGAGLLARIATEAALSSDIAGKLSERIGKKPGSELPKVNPQLDQEKIFEEYASVLEVLSKDRTLILVLDDLQWADIGSVNLFFHLARQLTNSRLLLIGTYRPDDVALGRDGERHPFESLLNELKRYHGDIVLDLSRLDSDVRWAFTNDLIDSEVNHLDAAFRAQLFSHTEGHPLFTVELLRNLQERGDLVKDKDGLWVQGPNLDWNALPARVEGVIGERIGRLPEDLHETLNISSVMGYEFIAQVIALVQKVPELELVKNLSRELEKRYLLVSEQDELKLGKQFFSRYRFSHVLVQKYLYNDLSAGERRLLHGEIAATLESLSADHTDQFALQLARHFEEAGDTEKAVHYWTLAGDVAFQVYAQDEALAAYTHALELGKDAAFETEQLRHLYSYRGRAMELLGQFGQALKNYDEMLDAARIHRDQRMELDAMLASSTLYSTPTAVMDPEKGQALSEQALKLAGELGDQAIECKVLWVLLLANLHGSKLDQAIDYGQRSLSLARSLSLRDQIPTTLTDLGRAYNVACRFAEAETLLAEAARLWRELGNMPMLNDNLNTLLLNYFWSGQYKPALEVAQESLEVSRTTKNIWAQCWPRHLQGLIWFEYGQIDKALSELQASVYLAQAANAPIHTQWYSADLCWAYIQIGAIQKGMDLYHATRIPNQEIPAPNAWTPTAVDYALCEIATGQLDLAASTLAARHLGSPIIDCALKLAQCRLALARKDSAQAIAVVDPLLYDIQKTKINQYSEALYLKGQAHLMNGEQDSAKATFEQARLAADDLGSRWQMWQILAALAEVESDQGKSSALKSQVHETAQFIANQIGDDEMRSQFLSLFSSTGF
jgi:tetratricopeptide (TPR) repeat protein